MDNISAKSLHRAMINVCESIISNEPYLTKIDTIIGDGDHGTGMKLGFEKLLEVLKSTDFNMPYDLLYTSGRSLVKVMGGASGVLFGTLFMAGLEDIQGKDALTAEDLVLVFEKGMLVIQRRGRAEFGDKTMLDALRPTIDAMKAELQNTKDVTLVMKAGADGSLEGVQATKEMLPKIGRSKNFRDEAIGYPDPGAVSISIIMNTLSQTFNKEDKINNKI